MTIRMACVNSPHLHSVGISILLLGFGLASCASHRPASDSSPAAAEPTGASVQPEAQAGDSSASAAEPRPAVPPVAPQALDDDHPTGDAQPVDPFATFDGAALADRSLWYARWAELTRPYDEGGLDCAPADFRIDAALWTAELAPDRRIAGMLCQPGAYNFGFALFDVRRVNGVWSWDPLLLPRCADPPTRPAWDVVFLPTWDSDTQTLHAFSKARGMGDCGETETWGFDGASFCLAHCAREPQCNERLPPEWEPLFVDATCGVPAAISP